MKRIFIAAAFASLAVQFSSCEQAPSSHEASVTDSLITNIQEVETAKTLAIDTASSQMGWVGTKPTGKHNGTIRIKEGSLSIDKETITSGNFIIDMKTIVATDGDEKGNADLAGHLSNADFFDVENFPEARFVLTEVSAYSADSTATSETDPEYTLADPTHWVSGNLTLKDVTKGIKFPAKVTFSEGSVKAEAKFNIDRTLWGINFKAEGSAKDKFIHNKIHLSLNISTSPAQ